jgi:hypothetical protein
MDDRAYFGLSILVSFCAWTIVAVLFAWPALGSVPTATALMALIAPHMFRFIGLSFLVPGVVAEALPAEFARGAAYGDLIAAVLAMGATIGLSLNAVWAIALVWIFNIWGSIDLINAMAQGGIRLPRAGMLGAAFYIPTVIVPGLLVSHALIFCLLLGLE